MDRSSFFTRLKQSAIVSGVQKPDPIDVKRMAAEQKSTFSNLFKMGALIEGSPATNYDLININRNVPGGLGAFTGPVNYANVSHLLKRACFNASIDTIKSLVATNSWSSIFNQLFSTDLTAYPIPPAPVNPAEVDTNPFLPNSTTPNPNYNPTGAFIGVSSPWNSTLEKQRNGVIYAQWNDQILNSPVHIREKMVVFLSSLLVEQQSTIGDARFFYGYLNLLRTNAIGNYKTLVKSLVIDPGMLIYLNGAGSTAKAPNENFGRELQELFTISKGIQTSTGNYTNYSEQDVQAAAKVLTGWDVTAYKSAGLVSAVFNPADHDTSTKQFSADYGNATLVNNGNLEYSDLIDLIFNQNETAIYIATRIYRYFVYYYVDAATTTNIIIPLANTLRSSNYDLLPVLKQLLESAHFFDPLNIGCVIKDPISFTAGLQRNLGIQSAGADVISQASGLSMSLGNPDQVAGWKATYETPDFSEWWINSITMEARTALSDAVVQANPNALIHIVKNYVTDPTNPDSVVDSLASLFFPSQLTPDYPGPITPEQHDFLKGILLPGLPDFEWEAQIWGPYNSSPSAANTNLLAGRLTGLFKYMLSMAEYHLS
jgi:uncharacterized protein (DUF1800 family)